MPRRPRFSLRFLFGLTTLLGVGIGIWVAFIYEPPTHKIPLYEKARFTRGTSIRVGPNTIRLHSIARNRHDGTLEAWTGDGKPYAGAVPNAQVLADCAPWLDVVQFEFEPGVDQFEIIQPRIFEHQTRQSLSELDPAYGWQVVAPNIVQVYGLGKELPPTLDVWLRANSHESGSKIFRLEPQAGAEVHIPGGTFRLKEVQDGFAGWSSANGFYPLNDRSSPDCAIVPEVQGTWTEVDRYQIAAVTEDGHKEFEDRWLAMHYGRQSIGCLKFHTPLSRIDSLEIRPFGGRHTFFFEAVSIPLTAKRKFDPPPTVTIAIDGKEGEWKLAEFAPLVVRLSAHAGEMNGMSHNEEGAQFQLDSTAKKRASQWTLIFRCHGHPAGPGSVRFQRAGTTSFVPDSTFFTSSGNWEASYASHSGVGQVYNVPLKEIKAFEMTLSAP